jgi:hypothetical protein
MNIMWSSIAYGQNAFPEFPAVPSSNNTPATEVTTKPLTQPSSRTTETSSSSIKHGVRITSPVRDQQVPAGAILTISGISKDNATSDCHVNVNVNHVRPYQNTSATGPGGPNDYSNWTFPLTPKYTVIKQGLNEITTLVSVFDCTGLSAAVYVVLPLAGLLSTDISSCDTGTSTVLVSVTVSFVIVASLVDSLLDASNLSSVTGTIVVVSSAFLAAVRPSSADVDDDDGRESPKNLDFASSSVMLNRSTSPS